MTWSVEAIEGVRNAANDRAAKLQQKDSLRSQLQQLAGKCEELRSKIVATKEGGMITGEERIRELLGQLYGNVNDYEGRPTDYQAARAESLGHELEDVINNFRTLTQKELAAANAGLKKKKLDTITVLSEADWQKKREAEGGSGAGAGMRRFAERAAETD
jgi:sugar-specific transcriptional regulator TrmB